MQHPHLYRVPLLVVAVLSNDFDLPYLDHSMYLLTSVVLQQYFQHKLEFTAIGDIGYDPESDDIVSS